MRNKLLTLALAVGGATLATPVVAEARDCFILVHGHSKDNLATDAAKAQGYWDGGNSGNFIKEVTNNYSAKHAIVRWNSKNQDAVAYWQPAAAGAVANQIVNITSGGADSFGNRCATTDRFFVIAHSQGAQVMTYINGNAYAGAPYYNQTITLASPLPSGGTEPAPFSAAMSKLTAVFTIGGAINGSGVMDAVCAGGVAENLANLMGRQCVRSLTTPTVYNPRTYTGDRLQRPMYALGGRLSNPVSELLMSGEDDGVVSLRSQMNCEGSATLPIDKYLKDAATNFACSSSRKRHTTNSLNLSSVYTNHDNERWSPGGIHLHATDSSTGLLSCGGWGNMAYTIRDCVGRLSYPAL